MFMLQKGNKFTLGGGNILEYMHERIKEKKINYILTVVRPAELLPFSKSHEAIRIYNKRILSL